MKKIFLLSFTLSLFSFGMSFETFKAETKKNAKALQSQALNLYTTQEKNKILLRSHNPTFELESSSFNPKTSNSSTHYSAFIAQTVRTKNYYKSLEDKASASTLLEQAYLIHGKAGYMKELEKVYTHYVYQHKLLTLLQDEYTLSKKITHSVEQRYNNGSENRVAYLQAKTNTLFLNTQMYSSKQALRTRYYQLLAIAGLTKKITLEKKFLYSVSVNIKKKSKVHSKQQVLKAKKKLLKSQLAIQEHLFKEYELYGGVENEPEQSIIRLGIKLPLPIFNTNEEEKQLAKLQMQQLSFDKEQLTLDLSIQKKILKSSIQTLSKQYHALQTLKKEQQTLTSLLQEGYNIAQGSLFIMMNAKNKLIQTQKSLLQTQKMINTQKIELRFIQGQYNE